MTNGLTDGTTGDATTGAGLGIVGRLGDGERHYLAEILWGFLTRDYPRIARVHFEAGYVPPNHSVDAFAQALRAVGEPVIGKQASEVSMGRLLGQLFEITALFDMHLRPDAAQAWRRAADMVSASRSRTLTAVT